MDQQFWQDKWASNQIAFHNAEAHPLLVRNFRALGLRREAHIFVPLCGKSKDLNWLAQQGYRVTGAELSNLAVNRFFQELGEQPTVSCGSLQRYEGGGFVLFQGSIFDLTPDLLGPVDAVYDRAALVALPAGLRDEYASHLTSLTRAQRQLLICYEYNQACAEGPPFSVPEDEVKRLYQTTFAIELLENQRVEGGLKGRCPATEPVWLLR
ncbi:thiopurine S-methyltransferase [Terriglobus albidus]|uniref:thiopurine S-methyltransferase n=1 Tax=Terriglobus albidus TaxID=1592106 RepID=UPI0037D99449